MKKHLTYLLLIILPFHYTLAKDIDYDSIIAKYVEQYNQYKSKTERSNSEKASSQVAEDFFNYLYNGNNSDLQPQPILTFEEWIDSQPLTPEERKLFIKYKVQTTKEIKEIRK